MGLSALERYNSLIRPEIEGILNNIELPEGEKLIVKLYMMGRSEQRVKPIVMICCPDKLTRKKAKDLIRESELLERQENSGFGLGSTAFPFETSFVPQPLGKGIYLDINPCTESSLKVDVYGLTEPGIGRKLGFVASGQSGWTVQYATGGPIVRLGGHLYQLTVAHATKPIAGTKAPQEEDWDADECEFDGQSDEEDDEHIILSRGSLSPRGLVRDTWTDPDSDQQQSQQSSVYSDSYPETPDTRLFETQRFTSPMMSPSPVHTVQEHDEWKSSTLLGSFPMPDGYGGELDYLLIKLPAETSDLVKALNEVTLDEPFRSRGVQVHDIASSKNENVSILAITSRGPIPGNMLLDAVSLKIRRSCAFQQLLTVLLSKPLRQGDSGSAVIDAQTGHFYGYVLAEARREVERLATELRDRRSEAEGSRQATLLDPALVRGMQAAASGRRFQDELNALERWFYVVDAGQQGVALHTMLQNANPAHIDYVSHVLRSSLAGEPGPYQDEQQTVDMNDVE
ncbi:hypothetical protein INS49_005464 [Diaporthe citri]|uniref:uncharacterized protein n=1 Tax=Diaporthe citri TaxID=83186 RepID=UPI001C7EC5F9|nr:uncharacterized protein INS49_005464 [Diaporthe citri]KAG6353503.1 hypothetical protein INS49_005464 [Diaporthe citri]